LTDQAGTLEPNTERIILSGDEIGQLAPVTIIQPSGTYRLTPASRTTLQAIGSHQHLFRGVGLDWGCGSGCLSVVAARIAAVDTVVGIDKSKADVRAAQENAAANDVAHKTIFLHGDSYEPRDAEGRTVLERLKGETDFVMANPPASSGDDGFSFRRAVLAGSRTFLKEGGVTLLQISSQYSLERVERLVRETPGFTHEGVIASTPWVPFDQERSDLRHLLVDYAAEETRGGLQYAFGDPRRRDRPCINAREALDLFLNSRMSPLSRWQVHEFRFRRTRPQ
jgi:16S rRNA G966 N2-methylase RsmD